MMLEFLNPPFMQRALIAAVLVGITAPAIGIYLVQRRQALMGDGIGHIAMTGVGLGFLLSTSPVWMATAVAVAGAVVMELIRWYGHTRGDLALAMLFYGGMAGGVMLINLSDTGSNANLTSYLFGSLATVSESDVIAICVLAAFVVLVTVGLRRQLFAVSQDEEFARVSGLPVRVLNLLIAVTAAVTVTVAMRVVGLLLVSALMVVPVAAAQQITKSFKVTFVLAVVIGTAVTLTGTVTSYYQDVPPGATIVLLAIAVFVALTVLAAPLARRRARASEAKGPSAPLRYRGPPGAGRRTGVTAVRVTESHRTCSPVAPGRAGTMARHMYGRHEEAAVATAPISGTNAAPVRGRSTRQRAAVAAALDEVDEFRSAQELHDVLKHRGDSVGLTTVYRTLQSLADAGEVDVLRTTEGEAVYRRCSTGDHHHHLVCRLCGKAVEVEGPAVEQWAEMIAAQHGYVNVAHTVEIFGTCSECAASKA